jgi:hypothetical protein
MECVCGLTKTAVDAALDDAIRKLAGSAQGSDATQRPFMYLYCLPAEKAPLLLHLLDQEGTSAASIYPGYKGVVDALRESRGAVNYRDDPTESFGPSTGPANRVTIRRARNASARPCGPGFLFTKDLAIELTNRAGLS